jgi:NTE family protein
MGIEDRKRPKRDHRVGDGADRKRISLALQGGGAHGAFTWGVLDRLLEDERIEIEGLSGTSAGAMNAGALLQGWLHGGRRGAREALDRFWGKVAEFAALSPIQRSAYDRWSGNWNLDRSPGYLWADSMVRLFSPYQLNPQNLNPLRDFIQAHLDVEAIRAADAFKLFVAATNARTGEIRVFDRAEITPDVFLASACLPLAFQAVEIEGEPYWDGGYMGNPALFPLIESCGAGDIVIVQINPLTRDAPLRTASEILNRLNEITMNASLRHELQMIAFIRGLVESGRLTGEATALVRETRIHMIGAEDVMVDLGVASKMNAERDFLEHLRKIGRARADAWLAENFAALGERSTIDLEERFLRRTFRRNSGGSRTAAPSEDAPSDALVGVAVAAGRPA